MDHVTGDVIIGVAVSLVAVALCVVAAVAFRSLYFARRKRFNDRHSQGPYGIPQFMLRSHSGRRFNKPGYRTSKGPQRQIKPPMAMAVLLTDLGGGASGGRFLNQDPTARYPTAFTSHKLNSVYLALDELDTGISRVRDCRCFRFPLHMTKCTFRFSEKMGETKNELPLSE